MLYDSLNICCVLSPLPGVAVDGPNKTMTDLNSKAIALIKKKGKVKALDEALYSRSR